MNVLFDINHPAHVHLFKNVVDILKKSGHSVIITSRRKDITTILLDNLNLPHICLSTSQKGLLRLAGELIWRQLKLIPILLKNKIQVCVSVTGACSVHICKLFGVKTLVFYDTEHARLQNSLTVPFVTRFYTPESFIARYGKNHVTYKGFHDLAYLHPKYFTPNSKVWARLGLKDGQPFVIMRFVSWEAAHDVGQKGMSRDLKDAVIKLCSRYARVFIASEGKIDPRFEQYRYTIAPEWMHDALAFATLYIGEGGSMATEAAILGTPAVFISSLEAGVFDELQKNYELMFVFKPDDKETILSRIQQLLENPALKQEWNKKKERLINEKIDLTEFITQEILKYDA